MLPMHVIPAHLTVQLLPKFTNACYTCSSYSTIVA